MDEHFNAGYWAALDRAGQKYREEHAGNLKYLPATVKPWCPKCMSFECND